MLLSERCASYDKLQKLYDRECLVNWISDATTHCANQLLVTLLTTTTTAAAGNYILIPTYL